MLTITGGGSHARALSLPLDPRLKQLLVERRGQLGGDIAGEARFVIVEPGDSLQALEAELSFSVFQNPGDGTRFGDPDFGWIYHVPGMPYYAKTRAEQLFCSEADAGAAGYRRAKVR